MVTGFLLFTLFLTGREMVADNPMPDPARSRNYYLSANGHDNNDGKSKLTPWRSLSRLSEIGPLQPGDSVLLERGSVFTGTLVVRGKGSETREIYVGAYGTGERPVICGSAGVDQWDRFNKNIWMTQCVACKGMPGNLFINGQAQPLGRYPNEGYLIIAKSSGDALALRDTNSTFADHFWDGAEIVVRSSRWTIDRVRATVYENNTFQFSDELSYKPNSGNGYFLQNHLSTLDRDGEWFFDEKTNRIFLYSQAAVTDRPIRISVSDNGIVIENSNHVRVENLAVMHARQTGITVNNSSSVTLSRVKISGSGTDGLQVIGCKSPAVENSTIQDSNNNGVEWRDNVDGLFASNTILRTGLQPGRGASGNGTYIALYITGSTRGANLIRNNTIDRTGYSAIDFRTSPTTISHNLIRNFCLVKDDGGGIYTWNNASGNNTIEGNVILDGKGSGEGIDDPNQLFTSGIYIDDRSENLRITGNTIGFCSTAGIFIHNAWNINITGNRLFGNGSNLTNREKGQLLIKRDAIVSSHKPLNLEVKDNSFIATDESNYCIYFAAEHKNDVMMPGKFANNQFRARKRENTIAIFYGGGDLCNAPELFSLKGWQQWTSLEKGSTFSLIDIAYPELRGRNLISNGTMSLGVEGWFVWPDGATLRHDKTSMRSPSLQVRISRGTEASLYNAGFPLDETKIYCLSFSAKSDAKSMIEFVPLAAAAPWDALGSYTCFSVDTTVRRFTSFFKSNKSIRDARLNFKSNSTFWIDDVSLYEISAPVERENVLKLISGLTSRQPDIPINEAAAGTQGHRTTRSLNPAIRE